jgi:hypothetical protein
MSKYDGLTAFLNKPKVTLSFREVEQHIAPNTLPDSARNYRPWWGTNARITRASVTRGLMRDGRSIQ